MSVVIYGPDGGTASEWEQKYRAAEKQLRPLQERVENAELLREEIAHLKVSVRSSLLIPKYTG